MSRATRCGLPIPHLNISISSLKAADCSHSLLACLLTWCSCCCQCRALVSTGLCDHCQLARPDRCVRCASSCRSINALTVTLVLQQRTSQRATFLHTRRKTHCQHQQWDWSRELKRTLFQASFPDWWQTFCCTRLTFVTLIDSVKCPCNVSMWQCHYNFCFFNNNNNNINLGAGCLSHLNTSHSYNSMY